MPGVFGLLQGQNFVRCPFGGTLLSSDSEYLDCSPVYPRCSARRCVHYAEIRCRALMERRDITTANSMHRQRPAMGLHPASKVPLHCDQPVVKADCLHLLQPQPVALQPAALGQGGVGLGELAGNARLRWSFDDSMAGLSDMEAEGSL